MDLLTSWLGMLILCLLLINWFQKFLRYFKFFIYLVMFHDFRNGCYNLPCMGVNCNTLEDLIKRINEQMSLVLYIYLCTCYLQENICVFFGIKKFQSGNNSNSNP